MDIVLVGCRGFGKEHLRIYSKLGYDVAIVERDPEEAKRCLEQFRISKVYENYEDALRSNADIIDLVVPDGLHYEMGTLAIRAKKNLLVEKPITPDIDSGISLIQQANESKLKFMVAEQFYFDPSVAEAIRRIKNGEIGTPHTVIVIDEGTHYIDTLLNFGGNFRSLRSFVHRTWDYVGEDTAEAVFNFENGMHGIFFYSWNYPEYPLIPEFEIIGDNGSIYEDVGTKPLEPWTQRKRKTAYGDIIVNGKHIPVETYDVIEKEIGGFLESVEKDEPVPMPPEIALRDIITIDRIYKASSD